MSLTQDELKYNLHYDPNTGIFTRRISNCNRVKIGSVACCLDISTGYIRFCVNRKTYYAHRLAWLYVYGYWPKNEIDHINGIKLDNRIENLREATRPENASNQKKQKNNASGFKGVSWRKDIQKWQVKIRKNYKQLHLGYFDSLEEAYKIYCNAAEELHGEFANVG